MKSIILAAGTGSRLMPLTEDKPKCMVSLAGKKLIDWQIETFSQSGVEYIAAVTGYKNKILENYLNRRINKFYFNDDYLNNNMVSSLFYAEDEFDDDLIISYADIIFSDKVLKKLIGSKDDFSVVIDKNWLSLWKSRFENPLEDAETLVIDPNGYITEIGNKTNDINSIMGQYIGLMKFSKNGLIKIQELFYKGLEQSKRNELAWGKLTNFKKAYLTDLLQALINEGNKIKAIQISGDWLELDTYSDYSLYTSYLNENENVDIYNIARA